MSAQLILAAALTMAALVVLAVLAWVSFRARVEESDRQRAERLARELAKGAPSDDKGSSRKAPAALASLAALASEAGLPASATQMLAGLVALAVVGALVGYAIFATASACAALAILTPALAAGVMRLRARGRKKAFDRQFAAGLGMTAQSIAAGMSAETAFATTARYVSEPLKGELGRLTAEVRFGQAPLAVALERLAARTGSEDARFLAAAVSIHRIGGGSLSGIFTTASSRIEARMRLRGLVDSVTSSARWVSRILAIMPLAAFAIVVFGEPEVGADFWASPLAPLVIGAVIVLDVLGVLVIKRLYNMQID